MFKTNRHFPPQVAFSHNSIIPITAIGTLIKKLEYARYIIRKLLLSPQKKTSPSFTAIDEVGAEMSADDGMHKYEQLVSTW